MTRYARPRDSRLWQLKSRRAFALEHPVDEHAVLAVAYHEEERMLVVDLEMSSRDKAGVAHVDIDLTFAAVAADRDAPLSNHVLELAALEPCDRRTFRLWIPLHLRRTGRCRLQRQKSPRVALLGTRVRGHSTARANEPWCSREQPREEERETESRAEKQRERERKRARDDARDGTMDR